MGKPRKDKKRKRSASCSSDQSDCGNCRKLTKRLEKLETIVNTKGKSRSPRDRRPRHIRSSRSPSASSRAPRDRLPRRHDARSRSGSFGSVISRNRAERIRSPSLLSSTIRTDSVSHEHVDAALPYGTRRNSEDADSITTRSNRDAREDTLVLHSDVVLPDDILKIMGDDPNKENNASVSLHEQLAVIWQCILANGLKKTEAQSLLNLHQFPKNLVNLKPPALNPEVKAAISKQNITADVSYVEMQNQIGKGLTAIGKSISTILLDLENTPEQFKGEFLTNLCDSGRIFSNLFHRISITRKNILVPSLKITKELADDCIPGEFLFGSNFMQKLDSAKSLQSISKDLKLSSTQGRQSSSKPPTIRRTYKEKGGGQFRTPYTSDKGVSTRPLNFQHPTRRLGVANQERGHSFRYHKDKAWDKPRDRKRKY